MKKLLFALFAFILLSSAHFVSADIPVSVRIKPLMTHSIEFYNYSETILNGYQKFYATIYNIGSVGCMTRIRFDIYNSSDESLVASLWSEKHPTEAGGISDFVAYWHPFNISGNFNSVMKIYQCYDIFEGPKSSFYLDNLVDNESIKADPIKDKELSINKISSTKNEILFEIKASRDFEDIILSPDNYPPGWIFESAKINSIKKGETKLIKLNYEPSIWRENSVIINIFDEKNNYFSSAEYLIEKNNEVDIKDVIIAVMGLFLFIGAFLNIRQLKNKKAKNKK